VQCITWPSAGRPRTNYFLKVPGSVYVYLSHDFASGDLRRAFDGIIDQLTACAAAWRMNAIFSVYYDLARLASKIVFTIHCLDLKEIGLG